MASTPPFTADAAASPANAARRSTPTTLDARSAADQGTCFLPGDTVVRTLNKLVEHRKALDQWDSGPVMIEVATSFTNPTLKSIDLSSTIGHGKSVPRKGKRTDENCYWLNAEWTSNDVDFRQSTNDFPDIPIGTSADKLAHILSRDDVSSISLYADFNSNLLTIKQKKRANKGEQLEETVFDDDLGDDTDSPEDFARDMDATIRQNLTNSVTGQILLCAVWTTDEGKRKFDMYPEFVSVDDTEGTNAEERPLHNWCAKDGNNEIFNFLAAYLPSKAQWAYTFVFRAGGILFRKGNALSRVIKINSDADKQET